MPRHPFLSESELVTPSWGCCLLWVVLMLLFWGGVGVGIYMLTK